MVRASVSHTGGPRFESEYPHFGGILPAFAGLAGESPPFGGRICRIAGGICLCLQAVSHAAALAKFAAPADLARIMEAFLPRDGKKLEFGANRKVWEADKTRKTEISLVIWGS